MRGAERGPGLVALVQHERRVITDLERKIQDESSPPSWFQGADGKNNHMKLYLHRQIFLQHTALGRDKSDAAMAMSLRSTPLWFASDKTLVQKRSH